MGKLVENNYEDEKRALIEILGLPSFLSFPFLPSWHQVNGCVLPHITMRGPRAKHLLVMP